MHRSEYQPPHSHRPDAPHVGVEEVVQQLQVEVLLHHRVRDEDAEGHQEESEDPEDPD